MSERKGRDLTAGSGGFGQSTNPLTGFDLVMAMLNQMRSKSSQASSSTSKSEKDRKKRVAAVQAPQGKRITAAGIRDRGKDAAVDARRRAARVNQTSGTAAQRERSYQRSVPEHHVVTDPDGVQTSMLGPAPEKQTAKSEQRTRKVKPKDSEEPLELKRQYKGGGNPLVDAGMNQGRPSYEESGILYDDYQGGDVTHLVPEPSQATPEAPPVAPNPINAAIYAHYPSMRPNPGPHSTDLRGGGPYNTPEMERYSRDSEHARSLKERQMLEEQDIAAAAAGPPQMVAALPNEGTGMTLPDYEVHMAQQNAMQGPFNQGLNPLGYIHYGQAPPPIVVPVQESVENVRAPQPSVLLNSYPSSAGYGMQDMPYENSLRFSTASRFPGLSGAFPRSLTPEQARQLEIDMGRLEERRAFTQDLIPVEGPPNPLQFFTPRPY
jgi:hypothetical protein